LNVAVGEGGKKVVRTDLQEAKRLGISRKDRQAGQEDPEALELLLKERRPRGDTPDDDYDPGEGISRGDDGEDDTVPEDGVTDDYYAWVEKQIQANIAETFFEDAEAREGFVAEVIAAAPSYEDPDDFMLAVVNTVWFQGAFPQFATLSGAGVIPTLGFSEYRTYKREVQDSYKRVFGSDMTEVQFQADASLGHSARYLEGFYDYKDRVRDLYSQYSSDPDATPPESFDAQAEQDFFAGKDLGRVEKGLQAVAWQASFGAEAQHLAGRFGGGELTEGELKALGEQEAGLTSGVGLGIQRRVAEASARMERIFQGQTVRGQLTLPEATGRDAQRGSRVDVGA